ncbi:B-cell receptor CD22 [Myxocyprinus asiaticus]|uniref:B-cell receptor CD22 n=1 Tax=Myxocyprinus asiaticus TaxID=70543 RepID=UPI002221BCF5|nr:B-cell receptor CD22 [Myxocyprinus asiaticus]
MQYRTVQRNLEMSVLKITSLIIISSVLLHTQSADYLYFATLPHRATALTGSCVQIPCTFNISHFEDKLQKTTFIYGSWLKNISQFAHKDSFIAFNSSHNIVKGFSDIQMIGNLSEGNCTTVFNDIMKNHSDLYFFRLEMEPDVFKATFNTNHDYSIKSHKTVRINVTDSPQPPELTPNDLQEVMENTTVNVSCSAEAPCPKQPPKLSWSNIPKSAIITTQLQEKPDKTQSVFSQITFKPSYMDDRKNISCTVTYPRNTSNDTTVETTMMLQVLYPPKETHVIIEPSASVSFGTNVTLTCKSKASPSNDMNYTWYKHGQDSPLAGGKKISFTVSQNIEGLYFCTAENKHCKQSSADVQVAVKRQNGSYKLVIYGGIGVLALLLLSAVFFYCMRTKILGQGNVRGGDQAVDSNTDMAAIYSNTTLTITKKSEISEKKNNELHYGEIDFSKLQTDHMTKKENIKDPETEYAEVHVSER